MADRREGDVRMPEIMREFKTHLTSPLPASPRGGEGAVARCARVSSDPIAPFG